MKIRDALKIKLIAALLLGACLLARDAVATQDETFVMTTSVGAPLYFEDGSGLYNLLVGEIFERLGMEYRLVWLPSQRSLAFTNNGTDDGNIARTRAVEKKFTNLVRVPEKVFDFEFMVYSNNPAIEINGWNSLDPYVVGIINGWKIVERNIGSAKQVTRVNDYEQLFNLLAKNRVDVAVLDRVMGGWKLSQIGLDLSVIEPPLVKSPMFIYLHKKHAQLVPEVARVIRDMKSDGSFAAIYATALPGYRLQ